MAENIGNVAVNVELNSSKMAAGLKEMNAKTKAWAAQNKKDFGDAAKSVDSFGAAFTSNLNKLAGLASVGVITAKLVSITKEVMTLADEAEKIGASAGQFSLLDYAAQKNGASIQDVKKAYVELQKSVNEAKNGNKDTIASFNSIGIAYQNFAQLNADQRFLAIADALNKVNDENVRAAAGMALLGKSYTELQPLLAKGSTGIAKTGQQGANLGVVLSSESVAAIDKLGKRFEDLGNVLKGKFLNALETAAPLLIRIANISEMIISNWQIIAVAVAAVFGPSILTSLVTSTITIFTAMTAKMGAMWGAMLAAKTARYMVFAGVLTNLWTDFALFMYRIGMQKASLLFVDMGVAFSQMTTRIGAAMATFATTLTTRILPMLGLVLLIPTAIVTAFLAASKGMEYIFAGIVKLQEVMPAWMFGGEAQKKEWIAGAKGMSEAYKAQYDETLNKIVEVTNAITGLGKVENEVTEADLQNQKLANAERNKKLGLIKAEQEAIRQKQAKETAAYVNRKFGGMTEPFQTQGEFLAQNKLNLDTGEWESKFGRVFAVAIDKANTERQKFFTDGEKIQLAQYDRTMKQTFLTVEMNKAVEEGNLSALAYELQKQAAIERTNEMRKEEYVRIQGVGMSIRNETLTAKEWHTKRVADIEAAAQAQDKWGQALITAEQRTRALEQANNDLFLAVNPWVSDVRNIFGNFAMGFEDAIMQARSFGDVLKSLANDVMRLLLRQLVLRQLFNIGGALLGGTSFGKSAGIGGNLGDLTYGGGKAIGGPVGGNYGNVFTVGENGPETLFMGSQSGFIMPNGVGDNGGATINQTININPGTVGTIRNEVRNMLPEIAAVTSAAVADSRRRGGSYARSITS
jgi:hypothetical protein